MNNFEYINISGIIKESIVDGPGFRYTVFAQGCPHHCEGCHNPATWNYTDDTKESIEKIAEEISANPMLKGVTFSGGEPFEQAISFANLAKLVKAAGRDVLCYTGYTFEEICANLDKNNGYKELLENTDYLIDGKFILAEKSLMLKFRGSKNQRIIDVKKSMDGGEVIIAHFSD